MKRAWRPRASERIETATLESYSCVGRARREEKEKDTEAEEDEKIEDDHDEEDCEEEMGAWRAGEVSRDVERGMWDTECGGEGGRSMARMGKTCRGSSWQPPWPRPVEALRRPS